MGIAERAQKWGLTRAAQVGERGGKGNLPRGVQRERGKGEGDKEVVEEEEEEVVVVVVVMVVMGRGRTR
jgi:hypothetical protein